MHVSLITAISDFSEKFFIQSKPNVLHGFKFNYLEYFSKSNDAVNIDCIKRFETDGFYTSFIHLAPFLIKKKLPLLKQSRK